MENCFKRLVLGVRSSHRRSQSFLRVLWVVFCLAFAVPIFFRGQARVHFHTSCLVHSSLLSLSAYKSFCFEQRRLACHFTMFLGVGVGDCGKTEPGREGKGGAQWEEGGRDRICSFFLAASPQKPDSGLRRFCVVRVWLQDECFSVKLWQCIKKVWIMFFCLFFFIWVRIRTERWVRCRFFLAR